MSWIPPRKRIHDQGRRPSPRYAKHTPKHAHNTRHTVCTPSPMRFNASASPQQARQFPQYRPPAALVGVTRYPRLTSWDFGPVECFQGRQSASSRRMVSSPTSAHRQGELDAPRDPFDSSTRGRKPQQCSALRVCACYPHRGKPCFVHLDYSLSSAAVPRLCRTRTRRLVRALARDGELQHVARGAVKSDAGGRSVRRLADGRFSAKRAPA